MGRKPDRKPAARPCCPSCRHPGFLEGIAARGDGRPEFECDKCRRTWTSGKDGRQYAGHGCGRRENKIACNNCGLPAVAYERCAACNERW